MRRTDARDDRARERRHRLAAMHERFPARILDKHSTGGVGDNVSTGARPDAIAACGAYRPDDRRARPSSPTTGGTLGKKLEAIPGYASQRPTVASVSSRAAPAEAGCAIIGQTDELAPADRRPRR